MTNNPPNPGWACCFLVELLAILLLAAFPVSPKRIHRRTRSRKSPPEDDCDWEQEDCIY